ncbi:MAG: hypothetical protein H0M93_04685 [Methanophagales archaeon]|nr:hypothetical protein [Methanophagales archaeon]
MVMIMGLALMIYGIAEKKLRYTEDRGNAKQKKKDAVSLSYLLFHTKLRENDEKNE